MKQYHTVEMLIISIEDQDILTISNGSQYVAGDEQSVMRFGESQYD